MKEIKIITVDNEDQISTPKKSLQLDLENYKDKDLEPQKARELANLIRIAATDYQCFNNWFENQQSQEQNFTLEEGREIRGVNSKNSFIYTSNRIETSVIDKYFLSEKSLNSEELQEKFPDESYYEYKILKTYEYVSFYPFKLEVELDRFGFIAERKEGDKTIIFVVFRGTREIAEWFSNAQFKQIPFLATEDEPEGIHNQDLGKISLGFNKMYTEFRPGIFMEHESVNKISRTIDDGIQQTLKKLEKLKTTKESIKEQSIYQAISEFFSSNYLDKKNASIYITGHSLGAALATIAAMDIAVIDLIKQDKLKNPIYLYTFASPRVGDNKFAQKFNEFIEQNRITAFRFANSEDLVPKIPLPVWFKAGIDFEEKQEPLFKALESARNGFNKITGDIFEEDYQHVGLPIYFTHQAIRKDKTTGTVGDNHNMTSSYCGALEMIERERAS
jgi:hypothetical protein